MKNNRYDNMSFNEIDIYLSNRYPSVEPGVLCIQKFDPISAVKDYELHIEIDNKELHISFILIIKR